MPPTKYRTLIKPSPLLSLLRQHRATGPEAGAGLLAVPFVEWCQTLTIKSEQGLVPFELFPWQGEFAELIIENPRTPISLLSSRQTGKSAVMLALLLWFALSREQFTGLIVHRKLDDAKQLARRLKRMIPAGVKLESDSLSLIEFAGTGSQIHFRSCNPKNEDGAESAGRGLASVDIVVCEEASHTSNLSDLLGVIGPCLTWSDVATIIMIGTAGKRESYYYDCLTDAYRGRENLEARLAGIRAGEVDPFQVSRSDSRIACIANWRAIERFRAEPDYLGRIKKEQDLTDGQLLSEHELVFDSETTTAVFDFADVKKCEGGQWEKPCEDGVYYAAVDGSGRPKKGRKGDYTVCLILKKLEDEKLQVVALYRKRGISFERRYSDICDLLNSYSPIKTLIESNDGLGQSYVEHISTGCPGLNIARFNNNHDRKAAIVNKIQLALEKNDIIIPKSPIIQELLSFQELDDGTLTAVGKDSHDDCVVGLGMALQAAS